MDFLDILADTFREILYICEEWGIIVVATFAAAFLIPRVIRIWGVPAEAALAIILGACIGLVGTVFYLAQHYFQFSHIKTRSLWFIVLYLWCVLGMLFFAGKNTSHLKIVLALIIQAAILYVLYAFL